MSGENKVCDVCEQEVDEVIVASVPMMPISVGYCIDCYKSGAIPYQLAVINTALVGGLDKANDDWKLVVHMTLNHLGFTEEFFNFRVEQEIKELEMYET